MYEKCHPKVAIQLMYGSKIRYCKAIMGLLETAQRVFEARLFRSSEVDQIKEICQNAIKRAEESRNTAVREIETIVSATEVSSGAKTEHREYNGK